MGRGPAVTAAVGVAAFVAYFGGDWARALPSGDVRVASVDYVLTDGLPARVGEVKLTLAEEAREVQVRLGQAAWIRCAVAARTARCRVPPAQGDAAALERLSVFVRA